MAETVAILDRARKSNRKGDWPLESWGDPPPADVIARADYWLKRVQSEVKLPTLTALQPVGEQWWLYHARKEAGFDRLGRSYQSVTFARLAKEPANWHVVPVMQQFAEACRLAEGGEVVRELSIAAAVGEPNDGAAARALLALALGRNYLLQPDKTVTRVFHPTDGVPLSCVRWVVLVENRPPGQFPDGPGLLLTWGRSVELSGEAWQDDFRELKDDERRGLHHNALAQVDWAAAEKVKLVRQVRAGAGQALPKDMPVEALCWLARFGAFRRQALQRAPTEPKMRSAFLQGLLDGGARAVRLDDLKAMPGRLRPEDGPLVLKLLEGSAEAGLFDAYLSMFPEDAEPPLSLLTEGERGLWDCLVKRGSKQPPAPEQAGTLERLTGLKRFRACFTREGLAWAAQTRGANCCEAFRDYLVEKEGMPEQLARAVMGEHFVPISGPALCRPEADWSWLQGVEPHCFLEHGGMLDVEWWSRGVQFLLDNAQVQREAVIKVALRSDSPQLLAVVQPRPPLSQLLSTDEKVRVPPDNHDPDWVPAGGEVLARWLTQQTLWFRLAAPLTTEGMAWLEDHIQPQYRARLQEVFVNLREGRKVAPKDLRALVPLLERRHLLPQVARLGTQAAPDDEQQELIDLMLDRLARCGMELAKVEWLRTRLTTLMPLPETPMWRAGELVLLRDLFEGVESLLRAALRPDRPSGSANERDLAARIEQRLAVAGPGIAPPPPDEEQRARHPELVRAVAKHCPAWQAAARDIPGGAPS